MILLLFVEVRHLRANDSVRFVAVRANVCDGGIEFLSHYEDGDGDCGCDFDFAMDYDGEGVSVNVNESVNGSEIVMESGDGGGCDHYEMIDFARVRIDGSHSNVIAIVIVIAIDASDVGKEDDYEINDARRIARLMTGLRAGVECAMLVVME